MPKNETIVLVNPFVVPRPPFVGRYYKYGDKKYLFTHRHPTKQMYWSDDIPVSNGRSGMWIPTEKLTPV